MPGDAMRRPATEQYLRSGVLGFLVLPEISACITTFVAPTQFAEKISGIPPDRAQYLDGFKQVPIAMSIDTAAH